MTTEKIDLWCVVELFGHARIAGKCTEQVIAGASMVRVDVPETEKVPAFTRFFNPSSIYSMNPVSEEIARTMAGRINAQPITPFDLRAVNEKLKLIGDGGNDNGSQDDDGWEDRDDDE